MYFVFVVNWLIETKKALKTPGHPELSMLSPKIVTAEAAKTGNVYSHVR